MVKKEQRVGRIGGARRARFLLPFLLLLLVASASATTVLIRTNSRAAGFNDAAYYAYHAGEKGLAEALYERALAENPSYERARYNLATLLFEEGRFDEAISHLELLVAAHPAKPEYHYDLAVNLIEKVRRMGGGLSLFDRAIAEYEEAERLSPGFARARENLPVLYRIRASLT